MAGIKTAKWSQTGTGTITIAAPGAGRYLALSSLTITGDAAATITVADGDGTSLYVSQLFAGGGGFVKEWISDNELLGTENKSMVITVSVGNYKLSVTGCTFG